MTKLWIIIKDGFLSFSQNSNGGIKKFWSYIKLFSPSIAVCLLLFVSDKKDIGKGELILSAISIYTALIFNSLFVVPDIFSRRVHLFKDSNREEYAKNYILRFKNFTKLFVRKICLATLLGLILIIMLVINMLLDDSMSWIGSTIGYINVFLLVLLCVITISILKDLYDLIFDDIDVSDRIFKEGKKKE